MPIEHESLSETKTIERHLRHRDIISRMVYHGQSIVDIANDLSFTINGIKRIVLSPLFQAELQKELQVKQRMERDSVLQAVATVGAQKLKEAVETGKITFVCGDQVTEKALDGREIVAIAHDALDRTGHKPITKTVEAHMDLGRMIIKAYEVEDEINTGDNIIEAEVKEIS